MLSPAFFVRGDGVSGYFIGLGAAVFGLLAIGFSLQSLVIQNTAENRSAGLYELEGKDWVSTVIFVFQSLVSLGSFFLSAWANGVTADERKISIVGSMPVIALVLWSLYVLYRHTFFRMSPIRGIERVEDDIRKDLRWMGKIARQNAIVMERKLKDPKVTQHIAGAVMFSRMKPRLQRASQKIEFLFDYHDKLVSKQEHYAAREVLDAIRRILLEYLAASSSSLRRPFGFFGASTSDTQDFLINTLEDLVTRGKGYIHDGNDRGVTYVIGVFQDIVVASAAVKFYPERLGDNPVFTQCRAYFDQIAEEAIVKSATEALYQTAKAYAQMGRTALQSKLSIEFYSIVQKVHRIGSLAARRSELEPVWSACIHTLSSWIKTLLSVTYVNDVQFSHVLETWMGIAVVGLRNGMKDPVFATGSPLVLPLVFLQSYVDQVFMKLKGARGDETQRLESMLLRIIEQFKDKLYMLAKAIKTTQGQLVEEISKLIVNLCKILYDLVAGASTEYYKRKPKELIYKLMHIPANFIFHAGKSEMHGGFESLVDAIARIGLMAYLEDDLETARKSVELVTHIAMSAAEEKVCSYGSIHAPRIMEKACYIGILALKDGKTDLLEYTKEQIKAFEATFGATQQEMLNALTLESAIRAAAQNMSLQIMGIRDEKRKVHSEMELIMPGDEARKMFLPMIEVIDIDRFTKEIWQTWVTPSPLDKEVEEEVTRRKRMTVLDLYLRYRHSLSSSVEYVPSANS